MMAALRTAWQGREPRERVFLAVGALVVLAALIYALAIAPLLAAGRKAERVLPQLRHQAAEMASLAATARQLKARPDQLATSPTPSVLTQGAARFGLSPQIVASGDGGFDIQLNRAAVVSLADWLAAVQAEQRLFVREARLTAVGEGLVAGQLALTP